jgi:peptidoglycan/LPS O-acetylase OafA/YrhL
MRDIQLDNYRALAMLYVIFLHTCFWMGDMPEPYLSFVLISMAMVFFISGASISLGSSRRSLMSAIVSRLKRVVIPFYIYAVVIILLSVLASLLIGDTTRFGVRPFHLTDYSWRDVDSILLCQDVPKIPNNAHLWFIAPYLILTSTFPLQRRLIDKCPRPVYMAACIALFLLAQAFTQSELLRELLCYNIFVVAGYLYYRHDKEIVTAVVGLTAGAAILGYVLLGGHFSPMQDHKFPPDWIFAFYGLFAVCMLSLVFRRVTIPSNRFLRLWNTRGYTIYLYQGLAFILVAVIRQYTYGRIPNMGLWLVADFIMVVLLSTVLSLVAYPLERWIMKFFRS